MAAITICSDFEDQKKKKFVSHVWMWELDYKESWALKNWCFWTVVLEKTLESPLDCREIQPVHPKGNQSWIFIGRTDAEVEAPTLWPSDVKNWLLRKDPDAGRDWMWEEKGITENEMCGCYHQLNGLEFEQALGVGDGQGSLASLGSQRVRHTTERLNWTELNTSFGLGIMYVDIYTHYFFFILLTTKNIILTYSYVERSLERLTLPGSSN